MGNNIKKSLQLFQDKKIRSQWDETEKQWYFSVVDIVEALTESVKPRDYWYQLNKREAKESGFQLSTISLFSKFGKLKCGIYSPRLISRGKIRKTQ